MATVEVRDGRPVAVRSGDEALRAEGELLRRLAGPGIPEVVALDDDGDEVRLVTAVAPALPTAQLADVAHELAGVLARVHAAGVVHGPIHPEHVLGRPGAVLLAGWEEAGPGDPAGDVAKLGRLLAPHVGGDARLRAAVNRALAPDPPTMAALAESLRPAPAPEHHVPLPLLAGLAVALALVALGFLVRDEGTPAARSEPEVGSAAPAGVTTTTSPSIDVVVRGNVVERAGSRWTVGRPGDVVVVGDWDCDGDPTPAVVRPASGEVWVFGRWPSDGPPIAGRALGTVAGATGARARHADGCDRLEVVGADGQSTTVG